MERRTERNPVTLGEPGDSENCIHWGCGAFRSHYSAHRWGERVQREEGSIQGHLANKRPIQDAAPVACLPPPPGFLPTPVSSAAGTTRAAWPDFHQKACLHLSHRSLQKPVRHRS